MAQQQSRPSGTWPLVDAHGVTVPRMLAGGQQRQARPLIVRHEAQVPEMPRLTHSARYAAGASLPEALGRDVERLAARCDQSANHEQEYGERALE